MNNARHLNDRAYEIVEAARSFQAAAEEPGTVVAVPGSLAALEEALQVLSAAWYRLAADVRNRDGLSREQEAHLMATLHDTAAAFARGARASRDARSTADPIIARREAAGRRAA